MSWIKKIFQIFKSDDEVEYENIEDYPDEQSHERMQPAKSKKDSARDMDAKVAYQYPKGQFRFPVIPDGERKERRPRILQTEKEEKRPRILHTEKEERKSNVRHKGKEERERPSRVARMPEKRSIEKEKIKPIPKKTAPPLTRNEKEAANKKRPFQPTQIPSPIYGFERPSDRTKQTEQSTDPVEYELNDFTYEEIMRKIHPRSTKPANRTAVSAMNAERFGEKENKILTDKGETLNTQVAATLEIQEENEIEVQKEHELNYEERNIEEKPAQDFEKQSILQEDPDFIYESQEVEAMQDLDIETKESEIEQDFDIEFEEVETTQEVETNQNLIVEKEKVETNQNLFVEKEKVEADQELSVETQESIEESSLGFETAEQIKELKPVTEDSHDELELSLENQETSLQQDLYEMEDKINEESKADLEAADPLVAKKVQAFADNEITVLDERKSSSSRSHIPFNVIMLNKDRQKLKQQSKPAIPVNTEKPVEAESKNHVAKFPVENTHDNDEDISYYEFPSKSLLTPPIVQEETSDWLYEQEQLLNSTLKNFSVRASVVNVTQGPAVTRFEVQPEPGVKVSKITNLSDDIKLSLAARDIRIEAPIPGKHTIGIEVPNRTSRPVLISEIINTPEFNKGDSPLTAVLGLDISGKPIVTDLRKMPHGLIAGATGSGKSVCINTILVSLLYKADPNELKLLLIDPKMVELAPYNRIPHLVSPVITDVKAATAALKWAVEEMERRYELFVHAGVRDINRFNELTEENKQYSQKLPYIVIIIDELADLMMMSPADVEEAICRIAQKARACGIHLIIATQRPSVDVITGLIKANVPTRIAFSVSSQIDSRTIIDISGAEKLLGRGDMLFLENGSSKPVRLQGTYVSDSEIDAVVGHARKEQTPEYLFEQEELLKKAQIIEEEDELFYEACEFVVAQGGASTSSLQRRFKIGYNRAARLIDMMEEQGFISENRGSKPRDVLITEADLESIQDTSTII